MPPLEIARLALLVIHLVGLAALIGPFLLQVPGAEAPRLRLMTTGAIVQVVTGIGLIASNRLQGNEVDELKMIVKLGIAVLALGVLVVAIVRRRRGTPDAVSTRPMLRVAGGAAVVNVFVAVLWT